MKFRKKPVVVEAEQFWPDRKPWPEGVEEEPMTHGNRWEITTFEGRY